MKMIQNLKRFIANILNFCKENFYLFLINNKFIVNGKINIINMLINIISIILLGIFLYLFLININNFRIVRIVILTIVFIAIFMFTSDNYKFSNIKIIKILQQLIFVNIFFALIGIILDMLGIPIINNIFCDIDSDDEGENESDNKSKNNANTGKDLIGSISNTIYDCLAIGAGGKVAIEIIRHTS